MAVTVVVHGPAGPQGSLSFDGTRVVFGRGSGSDVRLPDPSVSQRHASLRTDEDGYSIVDEGSTNGTWVAGVRLSAGVPRQVRDREVVRIGRVWLEIRTGALPAVQQTSLATKELALALVAGAMRALGDDTVIRAIVVEGRDTGEALPLDEVGREYTLGRGEECDLPLHDKDLSREHARIIVRNEGVFVRDSGSKNGTYVGATRVSPDTEVMWKPQVALQLGHTILALVDPVAHALGELEQLGDERVADAELENAVAPASIANEPADPPPPAAPQRMANPTPSKPQTGGVDVAIILSAIAVMAVSAAGLYWLLRG